MKNAAAQWLESLGLKSGAPASEEGKKPARRTALLAGFFALMLVFTVVSRAAEGMTMARVEAEAPKMGVITSRATLSGSIRPLEDLEITLPGSLYVTAVKAEPGDRVEEGDVLLEFDTDDVEEQLEIQRNALAAAEARLAIAENGAPPPDNTAVENARASFRQAQEDYDRLEEKLNRGGMRAKDDLDAARKTYDNALADYDAAVAKAKADLADAAQAKVDNAQKALNSAKEAAAEAIDQAQKAVDAARESAAESVASAQYSYTTLLERENATDLEIQRSYELLQSAAAKGDKNIANAESALQSTKTKQNSKIAEAQSALSAAQRELLEARLTRDVTDKQGVISAQNAVDSAARSLQSAQRALEDNSASIADQLTASARSVAAAQRNLDQAVRDAAEKARTSENAAAQTGIDILTQRADIAARGKAIAALEDIRAMEGKLLTPVGGTVQSIAGAGKTQEKAVVARLARGDTGCYFSAKTDSTTAQSLAVGDTGQLSYRSEGGIRRADAVLTDIGAADDNGNVAVKAALPQGDFPSGVSGEMTLSRSGERQGTCVPVSALRSDSDGDYVLVVREKKSAMGLEYSLERVDVTVTERDSALAALQGGLERSALVVTGASKPVAAGDRVRLNN